jgi:predicted ATPase
MIRELTIEGFKRFEQQLFEVAPLTVLAGLNGTGKSSLIQALLLAREASLTSAKTVRLNGPPGLDLGTAEDIHNWDARGNIVFDTYHDADQRATWRFTVPEMTEALYLDVQERPEAPPPPFTAHPRVFTYLSAERLGPRGVLGTSALPMDALELGVRGEYCAQVLAALGDRPIEHRERLHPNRGPEVAPLLKYELENWLGEIVRPVQIGIEPYPGGLITALQFRTPGEEWVRAPNMGFGVSYALPVVLAGLVAAPGGLLMVENPEAHLHPAGQSRIGVFLAWLAGQGVQTIVETHSDHVLNGMRRAIGEHNYLTWTDAVVQFFDTDENGTPRAIPLRFTPTGGVSDWPPGFFDQYQIDVAALGRIRRRR